MLLVLHIHRTGSSSSGAPPSRPAFLSHVDEAQMEAALRVAKERHEISVGKALQHYDTDSINPVVDPEVAKATFQKYEIDAPGSMPDFGDELERAIYVSQLFSKEECEKVIRDAEEFTGGEFGLIPSGQYFISGIWIKDAPPVREWFCKVARQRLFPVLQRLFPDFIEDPGDLCIDSAYLFKYTPETGRRTDVHTDSGCLSFTIALNSHEEYGGGGTWFEGLKKDKPIVEMEAGQVTLRPGGVRHAGCATESGERYIIGGFMLNRKRVEKVRQLMGKDPNLAPEEQKKLTEAAICLNPQCDIGYGFLANYYEEKVGEVDKAKKILEYGLEHAHPGAGEIAYGLGCIYLDEGNYNDALRMMQICLEMDEFDIDALTTMGDLYNRLGDPENERATYERIVQAPAAADNNVAIAYCNLGVLSGGTDDEMGYFVKALEKNPAQFASRYSLGAAYGNRNLWNEATECFRVAVSVAKTGQDKEQALMALYKAVGYIMQTSSVDLSNREIAMTKFQEIMGAENWEALVTMQQRRT